jgi:hypothetical protein
LLPAVLRVVPRQENNTSPCIAASVLPRWSKSVLISVSLGWESPVEERPNDLTSAKESSSNNWMVSCRPTSPVAPMINAIVLNVFYLWSLAKKLTSTLLTNPASDKFDLSVVV